MFTVIVKVSGRGLVVSTTEWRAPSPRQSGGAETAHAEFVVCDQSIETNFSHVSVFRSNVPIPSRSP